jgi:hypothetical protein
MASLEVFTQFTEDAIAQEDRVCQRPSCAAKIRKGEPCHYIATVVHGQPGRFVCGACYQRYQRKAATGVRPSGVRLAGRHSPDLQDIRQSVNAAQRSCQYFPSFPSLSLPAEQFKCLSIHTTASCGCNVLWTQSCRAQGSYPVQLESEFPSSARLRCSNSSAAISLCHPRCSSSRLLCESRTV